jgi:anti-sigma regulatory factor (Ser/Thr protein kinase)
LLKHALPVRPESIGRARAHVRESLREILPPGRLVEAELLTSELFTNAVRHAQLTEGDPIGLGIDIDPRTVRVCIIDAGAGLRFEGVDPRGREGGWGHSLMEALADRWGIDDWAPFSVWFEIDR